MPGVNHLTYKMKGDNERSDDVTLVGYAKSEDDTKAARDERLSNPDIRAYWEKYGRENIDNLAAPDGSASEGYTNNAFNTPETDTYRCNNNNDNDDVPPNPAFDPDRRNGNYGIPVSECSDSGSGSSWAEDTVRRCCSKKVLYKRIPVLNLFENYRKDMIPSDLVAGITVGMSMVPQAIAYASVAGLPAKYGLYSSFLACFIYVIFGSCKNSAIGPTAIQAILIRENIHDKGPSFAILLCFLTGFVQLIMGALQLGFLVDFISGPVSAGFTSAAAIVIAMTQVKDLLGLNFSATKFTEVWVELSKNYQNISIGDAVLGFSCIIILFVLRKIKDVQFGSDCAKKTSFQRSMSRLLWFLSTARSILVVLTCGTIAFIYEECLKTGPPFKLSSNSTEPGLPNVMFPPFSATVDNQTYNFFNMTSTLGSGIIIVPLLSLLENISLAKVFSEGKPVDATQELIALGACNLLGSFVGSMPMSGGLSRGAINHASGAKSTVGSIYAGTIVIVSLLFLTPYFPYIPKAALAAVIISAVIFMIEFQVVKPMWRTKKIDLLPAAATFLCCLLIRLEVGILVGVTMNVLFLLYGSARPSVSVDKFKSEWGYEYIVITPDRSLAFPSVEYVRNVVSKAGVKQGYSSIPIVIDSRHVTGADFTVARGIKSLIEDFVQRNQLILFYNLKPSVVDIFRAVRPSEFHHCQTEHQLHNFLKDYHFRSSHGNAKLKA